MSREPGGVESDSDAVFGGNAPRFESGAAQSSETLADGSLLVKLAGVERKCSVSAGKDGIEKRNGVSDLNWETGSDLDVETSGSETENDSDGESEDFFENRDLDVPRKHENLRGVVLAGSASANENLKLSDSDLVWAKVRSYPWWPGQVFDASVASENAMKHFKKGKLLVAYFGDCSFAWNDASRIKPFHQHFSQMEKQSNSPLFRDAIGCALEEVSRRVEFGLSCPCISEEAFNKLKTQSIINPGIREDSSVRYGGDELSNAIFFEPAKLVEYMKHLACFPIYGETDKLQSVNNRAQLLAFLQWKSYLNFPKYETFLRSVESAEPLASLPGPNTDEEMSPKKRKTDIKDNAEQMQRFGFDDRTDEKTKEKKTLSDIVANKSFGSRSIEKWDGKTHSEKKRKTESSESGKSEKKIKNNLQKEDSASKNSDEENSLSVGNKLQKVAEPCFGIGAIPLRVESEMTSLTPTLNPCSYSKVEVESKKTKKPELEELAQKKISSEEQILPDEMLSTSLDNAKTQKRVPESISIDHSNYEDFEKFLKEIACGNLNDDSKKSITETSEFRDVKDSSEQQILPANKELTGSGSKEQTGLKDCSADSPAPNALILKFADSGSVPSEEKLNSIFSSYGPLRESETQVMKKGKRAKVVFKRGEDAKTAFSSSGKYSIFGPSLLSYSLKYVSPKDKLSNIVDI